MYYKFKRTTFFAIFILMFSFTFPVNSFAKWKDRSDELPGMQTGEILLYVAGAAALITVVYLVSKSNDNDKNDAEPNAVVADSSSTAVLFELNAFSMAAVQTNPGMEIEEPSVLPFVGLQRAPVLAGYTNNKELGRVVLGVLIKF